MFGCSVSGLLRRDRRLRFGRGSNNYGLVGFSPDELGPRAFGYYCLFDKLEAAILDENTPLNILPKLQMMYKFWEKESTANKVRHSYPDEMAGYLPSDDWMHDSGIAFPLYRLTGGNINFRKLLQVGIPGLLKEIFANREKLLRQKN